MSSLSHTIRRFNRFELKYLISLQEAGRIKQALGAYLLPDDHGRGVYTLDSLYYDSPDYLFFWEKLDGIRFRRKLRIRHYQAARPLQDDTPVFVEIKQRLDRVTQKRRVRLPYGQALDLCSRRVRPEAAAQDMPVIEEVEAMLWQYNLRPASVVRYQRQALVGSDYDIGLRVTFDSVLSFRTGNLDLREQASGLPLFPPDRVVMEIKVNERIPYWLTELVAAHNLQLVRVSKYCRSIELSQKHPSARWLVDAI